MGDEYLFHAIQTKFLILLVYRLGYPIGQQEEHIARSICRALK